MILYIIKIALYEAWDHTNYDYLLRELKGGFCNVSTACHAQMLACGIQTP